MIVFKVSASMSIFFPMWETTSDIHPIGFNAARQNLAQRNPNYPWSPCHKTPGDSVPHVEVMVLEIAHVTQLNLNIFQSTVSQHHALLIDRK